jgi:hypothetical protein
MSQLVQEHINNTLKKAVANLMKARAEYLIAGSNTSIPNRIFELEQLLRQEIES